MQRTMLFTPANVHAKRQTVQSDRAAHASSMLIIFDFLNLETNAIMPPPHSVENRLKIECSWQLQTLVAVSRVSITKVNIETIERENVMYISDSEANLNVFLCNSFSIVLRVYEAGEVEIALWVIERASKTKEMESFRNAFVIELS